MQAGAKLIQETTGNNTKHLEKWTAACVLLTQMHVQANCKTFSLLFSDACLSSGHI